MGFYVNSIFRMVWYIVVPKIFEVKTHFRMTYQQAHRPTFLSTQRRLEGTYK